MGPQWAPLIPLSLVYMSSLARSLFTLIADPAALLIPALLIPAWLIPALLIPPRPLQVGSTACRWTPANVLDADSLKHSTIRADAPGAAAHMDVVFLDRTRFVSGPRADALGLWGPRSRAHGRGKSGCTVMRNDGISGEILRRLCKAFQGAFECVAAACMGGRCQAAWS